MSERRRLVDLWLKLFGVKGAWCLLAHRDANGTWGSSPHTYWCNVCGLKAELPPADPK